MRPSVSQLNSLKTAALKYHQALPGSPAEEYLVSRGLDPDLVVRFGLGYVSEPEIGHDMFKGRLSIPYTRESPSGVRTVRGIKFRLLQDHSGPGKGPAKYLPTPGFKPALFNTRDLVLNEDEICICEGELDAVAASVYGVPAVAAPGATTWQDKWNPIFYGYETVFILADGDKAGLEFAGHVADQLPNAKIVPMHDGEDVNSMIQKYGIDKIREMIGRG